MSDQERKTLSIAEFRASGMLQEVNRRFFHPLGLALSVTINDDGTESLGAIYDERDDPEGFFYGHDLAEYAGKVAAIEEARRPAREARLGFWIEPTGKKA